MQVRITLAVIRDEDEAELASLFLFLLLDRIDTKLFRTPDYVIRGRHKITITFYGLSEDEADKIYKIALREIGTGEDSLITRAMKLKGLRQEEDMGNYRYIQPEYKEGVKENLESNKGFDLDIKERVGKGILLAVWTTASVLYDDFDDEDKPLSIMAALMQDVLKKMLSEDDEEDPRFLELYVTRKVTKEHMVREGRKPRPKKPKKLRYVIPKRIS